jgi:hypothetical protein
MGPRALVFAPVVNRATAQAKAEQDYRTSAAVADCANNFLYTIRTTEIDLSASAGKWELHHRQHGGFALTRSFGEVLLISQCADDADNWTVTYDEPIDPPWTNPSTRLRTAPTAPTEMR